MLLSLPRTTRLLVLGGAAAVTLLTLNHFASVHDVEAWKTAVYEFKKNHHFDTSRLLGKKPAGALSSTTSIHAPTAELFSSTTSTLAPAEVLPSTTYTLAPAESTHAGVSDAPEKAPCQALEGADDILVVLRTGASEIEDRVPSHLKTTFLCYPHTLIFSDYAEDSFYGHKVWDVLADIDEDVINNNDDFEYYRKLRDYGRISLHEEELAGKTIFEGDAGGKDDNLGWRLDKWKFLPMMNMTLHLEPDKKWYVFVEPDSYLVWSNLLRWLSTLDPNKASYYGSEILIGDDAFAHGGSVWVLSKPALEKVAQIYVERQSQWNELLSGDYWAGDCMLGRALNDTGVPVTQTWPMIQGGNPSLMDFEDLDLWCAPALTFHHVSEEEVRQLWNFEQDWIRASLGRKPHGSFSMSEKQMQHPTILHKDVLNHLVLPKLKVERDHWDNHAEMLMEETESATMQDCHDLCEYNDGCKLFSIGPYGCSISFEVKVGQPREDVRSGWMTDRIFDWMDELGQCEGRDSWTVTS